MPNHTNELAKARASKALNDHLRNSPEDGSFEAYLQRGGSFVKAMAEAIAYADPHNVARIRRAFPQMIAAYEAPSWNRAPEGFEPKYDGARIVSTERDAVEGRR